MNNLHIIIANPAGNITAFVLEPVERSCYAEIARRIFDIPEYGVEQVGFIIDDNTMEMSGLEFCGNATRSFGLLSAIRRGETGAGSITVQVSGSSKPLVVEYDTETRYARICVELPLWTMEFDEFRAKYELQSSEYDWMQSGTLVVYEGIAHAVVPAANALYGCQNNNSAISHNPDPSRDDFERWFILMRDLINDKLNPPAMGVVYCEDEKACGEAPEGVQPGAMKPIVYVKDVDSIYFEGSCGSGTTAYAAAYSKDLADGTYRYSVEQPEGTILATCVIEEGNITELAIESEVEFSEIIELEI